MVAYKCHSGNCPLDYLKDILRNKFSLHIYYEQKPIYRVNEDNDK